jgi:hypothetical protein
MSVISVLTAMPNRISIVYDFLSAHHDVFFKKNELIDILSPSSSSSNEESEDKGKKIADGVISEMIRLELISIDGNGKVKASNSPLGLRKDLYKKLFDPNKYETVYKQGDLVEGAVWLLCQDPFSPIQKSAKHAELLREQLPDSDELIHSYRSDARFQNLAYWTRYLGLSEWMSLGGIDYVVPDPSRLLLEFLPQIFAIEKDLHVDNFLQKLRELCPLFEGGVIRESIEARLLKKRDNSHFSRSTSLSLQKLSMNKIINLDFESDAKSWVLDLGATQKSISRISLRLEK